MLWIVAGVVYAALYAVLAVALGHAPAARLWAGNVGLLIPPLIPAILVLTRRREWRGRHVVFLDAIGAGAALWFAGQVAWAADELFLAHPQPWVAWDIVPQFCGVLLPLIALIAAPHRGQRRHTATPTALDVYGLTLLIGFLFWSTVIAPGMQPERARVTAHALAWFGPAMRIAVLVGYALAIVAAKGTPWVAVYRRMAAGTAISFFFLAAMSTELVAGGYATGSPLDLGWILQFFFYASAVAAAPVSEEEPKPAIASSQPQSAPLLLFGAILAVPVVSMLLRRFMPVAPPYDGYREVAEDLILIGAIVLGMIRVVVEQRVARRFGRRVRLLAAACEQTSELIVITRGEIVQYANSAFCRALGYSQAEVVGLERGTLVADDAPAAARGVRSELDRGETVSGTVSMRRRDGTTFTAAIAAAPLAGDDDGQHYVAVVRDLTDELRMREQLVRNERLSAVGEVISSIAHQINNPLQSVVGMVDLLLAAPHADELKPDLERVRTETWRAGHIIRNLLLFVRKTPGERFLGELNEVVQSTIALCRRQLEASKVRVVQQYGADLPLVLANTDELRQVVLNLVNNAQQSLGANNGGTLTVRTYARGNDAVLEIVDDGPGVAPELVGRLFEPFVTTKDITSPNGFGLSTSFGIVAAHGGALEYVPTPVGACFRITLPGAGFAGPVVHSI